MIAAALPVGWFDGVAAVVLVIGFIRGRKRGMSQEVLDLIRMLASVLVAGLFYRPLSQLAQGVTKLPPILTHPVAYLAILAAINGLATSVKHKAGEKLFASDPFGRLEFPLGGLSGMVRWACGLVIVLSLLSTKLVTDEENKARAALANKELGSDYFAMFNIGFLQHSIFKESFLGSQIKQQLSPLLIEGSPMGKVLPKHDDSGKEQ